MGRLLRALAIALAATATGVAVAAAPVPAPRASLQPLVCHRALDPAERYVSETAVMRPVPGTEHLEVRFRLLERPAGAPSFAPVSAPGLWRWVTPRDSTLGQRSADVWKVVGPVAQLGAPATYRFEVEFRWIGAAGQVLRTETRRSGRCFQPELRPDLVVRSVSVSADPRQPSLDDYLVEIDNTGATAAGPFTVAFSDAGVEHEQTVDRLGARSSRRLTFIGPHCRRSGPPTVTADPQNRVDVYTRSQATLTAVCPAG